MKLDDELVRLRVLRRLLDGVAGRPAVPGQGDVLGDGAREEEDILLDGRDLRAQRVQAPVAHIHAVDQDAPLVHIVDAIDQLGQRALARAGLPDDGDGLARLGAERDVFEHGCAAIAEADMLEDDFAAHLPAIAALVLVQFGLFLQNSQDAPRAGDAQLHQVKGPDRDAGRKAQRSPSGP